MYPVCYFCVLKTKHKKNDRRNKNISDSYFSCISCNHNNYYVDQNSTIICTSCAVDNGHLDVISKTDTEMYYRSLSENNSRKYKRLHYLNELLSQYFGGCPPVPKIFFILLKEAFNKRRNAKKHVKSKKTPGYYKSLIHTLCKSVCLSNRRKTNKIKKKYWVQLALTKKCLQRYKNKENFYDLRKYGEKWRFLIRHLEVDTINGSIKQRLVNNCMDFVRDKFLIVEKVFEDIRHNRTALIPHNCKIEKCKKSMISYSFIIVKLIKLYFSNAKDKTVRDEIISWWPRLSAANCFKLEMRFWIPIVTKITSSLGNQDTITSWLETIENNAEKETSNK